tara:strand:- start:147 stop:392 length:246 start_codon:yes stop_codon:yes gene_type:complete
LGVFESHLNPTKKIGKNVNEEHTTILKWDDLPLKRKKKMHLHCHWKGCAEIPAAHLKKKTRLECHVSVIVLSPLHLDTSQP